MSHDMNKRPAVASGSAQRLKDRFVRLASEPADPPELKLRKSIGVAVGLISIPTWLTYSLIYFAAGATLAGQLALLAACAAVLLNLAYIRFRHDALYWLLPMAMNQLAFLAIHFALGGFTSSIYLLVYVLLPVFLTPVLEDPRHTKYWFASSVVLVLMAGVGESFIPHGNSFSPQALTALTVSIILGFAAFALLPALLYGQRNKLIEQQMAAEREAHLAQTQQALERQTATAEMLKVISSSPTDAQPVFDTIVRSAAECAAACSPSCCATTARCITSPLVTRPAASSLGKCLFQGRQNRRRCWQGHAGKATVHMEAELPDPQHAGARQDRWLAAHGRGALAPGRQRAARSLSAAPRPDPCRSTTRLLETFADQAVIAIENARLFNETKEALEHQTATAGRAAGHLPLDLRPGAGVRRTLVDSAVRLCGAQVGMIFRQEGGLMHLAASAGPTADLSTT